MATLKDLLAQQDALSKLIEETRATEKDGALGQVHALISEYGLTEKDLFSGASTRATKTSSKSRNPVPAKYRDPMTGSTWSGRGLAPKWLQGKNKEDYLIN